MYVAHSVRPEAIIRVKRVRRWGNFAAGALFFLVMWMMSTFVVLASTLDGARAAAKDAFADSTFVINGMIVFGCVALPVMAISLVGWHFAQRALKDDLESGNVLKVDPWTYRIYRKAGFSKPGDKLYALQWARDEAAEEWKREIA